MKLDHIALNVENIERSVSWYSENLDSEVLYQDDTWTVADRERQWCDTIQGLGTGRRIYLW